MKTVLCSNEKCGKCHESWWNPFKKIERQKIVVENNFFGTIYCSLTCQAFVEKITNEKYCCLVCGDKFDESNKKWKLHFFTGEYIHDCNGEIT
jgi:CRISPR/Cas system-associated protein Csx1